ncbi:MAG TPA: SDR family oxidoreductase [Vicinamibacterales bacterium]|jgi:hypothetical protein
MRRPVALVTGASGGIGLALCRELAGGGHDLVLVARSVEKLDQVARELRTQFHVDVDCCPHDLSHRGSIDTLWREVTAHDPGIDVLVNNAGAGLHGAFSGQDVNAIERLITLNVTAVTMLTRLALPHMLAQRRGRILNVASLAAYQPGGPREAVYYATKAFVLSFTKALSSELHATGVTATALCPGPTRTSFDASAGASETALYSWMPAMSAASVARAGYRGMMRGSRVVIPGVLSKLMAFTGELPPRRIALEVNRLLLKER